ncbi:WXG100 family type VII secretion target [Actinosynnema sp. CS-041913]|uniref:WXG100 family type VII secretion target n=1 Tax=Actinosynnema sp. CS-041913 TaxID=3239917 RepID=UPI003D8DFEAE
MAVDNVSVATTGMKQAASLFEAASSSATRQMQSVNENQASLMASWTGDASAKFGQAMNDWERQFQIIIQELNHMIETMGGNATVYSQNEENATSIAGQWAGGLSDLERGK